MTKTQPVLLWLAYASFLLRVITFPWVSTLFIRATWEIPFSVPKIDNRGLLIVISVNFLPNRYRLNSFIPKIMSKASCQSGNIFFELPFGKIWEIIAPNPSSLHHMLMWLVNCNKNVLAPYLKLIQILSNQKLAGILSSIHTLCCYVIMQKEN